MDDYDAKVNVTCDLYSCRCCSTIFYRELRLCAIETHRKFVVKFIKSVYNVLIIVYCKNATNTVWKRIGIPIYLYYLNCILYYDTAVIQYTHGPLEFCSKYILLYKSAHIIYLHLNIHII